MVLVLRDVVDCALTYYYVKGSRKGAWGGCLLVLHMSAHFASGTLRLSVFLYAYLTQTDRCALLHCHVSPLPIVMLSVENASVFVFLLRATFI